MKTTTKRFLLSICAVFIFLFCFYSCARRDHSGKPSSKPIKMAAADGRILNLMETEGIKHLGSYSKTNDVVVRFIETSMQGVTEIIVFSSDKKNMHVARRCFDSKGKVIEKSSKEMSQAEGAKLSAILKNIRSVKYDIALSADPKAIDTGDYIIETYNNGRYMAYLRAGYSPNFPGDMESVRTFMLRTSYE